MNGIDRVLIRINEIEKKINGLNKYQYHKKTTLENKKDTNNKSNINEKENINNKVEIKNKLTKTAETLPQDNPFRNIILNASKKYNISPNLINAVIKQESNYDPYSVSEKGARGLMQLMPSTAQKLGVNHVFSPTENINAGSKYLSQLMKNYNNNIVKSLAAYNAGSNNVNNKRAFKFNETNDYIQKIISNYTKNIKR